MSNAYQKNHYVPVWYQKRFLLPNEERKSFYYLDLKPSSRLDIRGIPHQNRSLYEWGPKKCFKQDDLYTLFLEDKESTEIEERFFGPIDDKGPSAIEYFAEFDHSAIDYDAFQNMVDYMSIQKLRTPKGLEWLSSTTLVQEKNQILSQMLRLRGMYCAVWTECIWQIADASQSETKFLISDHPITVYNRRCGPRHRLCRGPNDPDVRLNGTHTIFPLSLNKLLILTNLSWVQDPYQSPLSIRPYPELFRSSLFKYMDIQIGRYLTEQEVREINFIVKSRAHRYIAAAREEWLYPEKFVSRSNWANFGDGYLFMPDPRPLHRRSVTYMSYQDGRTFVVDQFGRTPGQMGYDTEQKRKVRYDPLNRFKGEFAMKFGPNRRGLTLTEILSKTVKDSEKYHEYHLSLAKKTRSNGEG